MINLFYQADKLALHLEKIPRVRYTIEKNLTGTGGVLNNFSSILKKDFIYHSGDVISDMELGKLINFHIKKGAIATLALIKNPETNFVKIKNYRIVDITSRSHRNYYTFSGIAVLSPAIFSYLPTKERFSLVEVLLAAIQKGNVVCGMPTDLTWYNINTPLTYWKIHRDILTGKKSFFKNKIEDSIYISDSSRVRTNKITGFVSIGDDCFIDKDVELHNSIILPGTELKQGSFHNRIIANNINIPVC